MRIVKRTKPCPRRRVDEDLPAEASLIRYIESSALVAAIMERALALGIE